jgi:hypothetical protein
MVSQCRKYALFKIEQFLREKTTTPAPKMSGPEGERGLRSDSSVPPRKTANPWRTNTWLAFTTAELERNPIGTPLYTGTDEHIDTAALLQLTTLVQSIETEKISIVPLPGFGGLWKSKMPTPI